MNDPSLFVGQGRSPLHRKFMAYFQLADIIIGRLGFTLKIDLNTKSTQKHLSTRPSSYANHIHKRHTRRIYTDKAIWLLFMRHIPWKIWPLPN